MSEYHFPLGTRDSAEVSVNLSTLLRTRMLIQANSGGGKSWAIRRLLEQSHGKIQQIVLDVEGEFSTLRERFDYILVGPGGDIATDTRTAAVLAERLLELRASAIIDLFELHKSERPRYVKQFLNAMIAVRKELWTPCMIVLDEAHHFCLDSSTELLTQHGWKRWDDIRVGDPAITYDLPTGEYRCEPVQRVVVMHYDGEMVHAISDGIDCLATPEHRAVIQRTQRARGRYKIYDPVFCRADAVPRHVYVPIGGAPEGAGVSGLNTETARILGWVITDGSFSGGKTRRYLSISQSHSTVKQNTNVAVTMQSVLSEYVGVKVYPRRKRSHFCKGRAIASGVSSDFYLGIKLSSVLLSYLEQGVHRIPRRILEQGNRAQLESLYNGMLEGDGTCDQKGRWCTFYAGLSECLADDFQELTVRLGINSVKKRVPQNGQWVVLISRRKRHYIRRTEKCSHSGIVWDITVPSGAFIARRNGKVFVTGNCPERGDCEAQEAVIDLCTRGRKRQFMAVLATQRLSALAKSAAAECNNVLIGRTTLDIDVRRAAETLQFTVKDAQKLRALKPGHFYAYGPAISDNVTEIKVGDVLTIHPDFGRNRANLVTPPPRDKIIAVLSKLEDLPKVAKEREQTMDTLRARVRELERIAKTATLPIDDRETTELKRRTETAEATVNDLRSRLAELHPALADLRSAIHGADTNLTLIETKITSRVAASVEDTRPPSPTKPPIPRKPVRDSTSGDVSPLRSGAMKMLKVAAMFYPDAVSKQRMATLAGFTMSGGTFHTYLSELLRNQWLEKNGSGYLATGIGMEAAGDVDPLPTDPRELIEMWKKNFRAGVGRILDVLAGHGGRATKEWLAETSGFEATGGTFNTYLSELRRNNLVIVENGEIQLIEELCG